MAATRRSSRLANTKPPVKTLPVRPAISRKRARPAKSPQGLPTPKSVTPAVIATPTAQLTPPEPSPEDVVEPPKKRSRTSKPAKTPSETPLELSQPEASTCQAPVPAPAPALAPYTPKIGIQDLPLDITHTIFSYLQYHRIRHGKSIVDHPFVILSKTSHALRKAIESYSRHAYPAVRQRFADRLAPEEIDQRLSLPPSALWGETEFDHSPPNNSHTLLVADVLVNFCAFCAKRADCTYREYAKFATDVPCCPECDKEEWPQISLSKAVTEYNLGKVKTKILEEVRHAKFELNRTWTTVLLVKDVEDFAEKVHGCTIEDYFEAKEGRKKKRADSKTILAEHRRQELHAFIELNELDVSPQDLQDLENLIVEGSFAYTSTMMRSYMIRKKINYNAYLDLLEQLRIERFSGPFTDGPFKEPYMIRSSYVKKRVYPRLLCTIHQFLAEFGPDGAQPPSEDADDNLVFPFLEAIDDDPDLTRFFSTRMGQAYELYCLSLCKDARFNPNFIKPPGLELPSKFCHFNSISFTSAVHKIAPWSYDGYPIRLLEPFMLPPASQKPKTEKWIEGQKRQKAEEAAKLKRDWEKVKRVYKDIVAEAKWTVEDLSEEEQARWEKDDATRYWQKREGEREEKVKQAKKKMKKETRAERMLRIHKEVREMEVYPMDMSGTVYFSD